MDDRTLHVVELRPPYRFASPVPGEEFALLIVVQDPGVDAETRGALAKSFVEQGCRYACAWGHDATTWDDTIDLVGLKSEDEGEPLPFVMTTWHDEVTPHEAVFFFAKCTAFGPDEDDPEGFEPRHFLVVVLGGHGADVRLLELLKKSLGLEPTVQRP